MGLDGINIIAEKPGARKGLDKKIVAAAMIFVLILSFLAAIVSGLLYWKARDGGPKVVDATAPNDALPPASSTSSSSTSSTSSSTTTIIQQTVLSTTTYTLPASTTTVNPSCTDNIRNQGEEETDCGGPCEPCEKSMMEVASCLNQREVRLYLREDRICYGCRSLRSSFGQAINDIPQVDCDDDDNENLCKHMLEDAEEDGKDRGYPTWEYEGELYPGASIHYVRELTGC